MTNKRIPVILGADPFGSSLDLIIAAAEVTVDKIVITVERDRLVEASKKVDHIKDSPHALTRMDQVVGLALNVAFKADPS